MNYGGPPPTTAAPYNPNQPQAGAYGGYVQPNYQQGVQTSWPGGQASERSGLTRREVMTGGVGGVVGLLLGGGGVTLANRVFAPPPAVTPAQFWAYATPTSASDVTVTVNEVGVSSPTTVPVPGGGTVVTSRTAADTLALVIGQSGKWTLWYWTSDLLRSYPSRKLLLVAKTLVLTLATGAVGQVYDVRALTDQTGASQAIAVAMTDAASGAPQLVVVRLGDGSHAQPAVSYTPGGSPITNISFVGPIVASADSTLYVRVVAGARQSVVPAPIAAPASTPTSLPKPTDTPKSIPTNTPTPTTK